MYNTLDDIQLAIKNGEISCVALVEHYLEKIKASETNAMIESFDEEALAQAKEIDEKISNGSAGELAGLVIGIKDNIAYKGHGLTASSKILEGFESLYDATVTERLLKENAIIIGRLNCDEFAMGSANENSVYGVCKNPHDLSKTPGGSSGGSAAAVAEGLCLASLGTDTGGSVRQPAALCGVVGIKPTYGRISRHGIIAYGSSFDQVGVFAPSVKDTALITKIIAGGDDFDATSASNEVENYDELNIPSSPKKIAYFKECLSDSVDAGIRAQFSQLIEKLKSNGHQVEEVAFDYMDHVVPTYYVLTTAEASSNLARYDGIHYGYRSKDATDTTSSYVDSRSEGFGEEVKRRIMTGTFVLSAGYYEAYFGKAQKVRRLITDRTKEILSEYDFILSPTSPETAFEIGSKSEDPIKMYLSDIFTVSANITGMPAISLPLAKHKEYGLPVGFHITADKFKEKDLFAFSELLMNDFQLN